jgi:signal transduction histidine kinase
VLFSIPFLPQLLNVTKGLGYEVLGIVDSGEEAVQKAGERRPDLILMDIVLKGRMNGIDAAGEIRTHFNIPVVFLTAYSDDTVVEKAKQTEPFGYIIKPYNEREIKIVLQMALYKSKAEASSKAYLEQIRTMAVRLAEAEENERRKLSRELHDQVGQNLTALSINLNIIGNLLSPKVPDKVLSRLNDSLILVEETAKHIRDVMAELRPPVLDDYGLLATLKWYSGKFISRTGIDTVVSGEEINPRLASTVEMALFYITKEALNNTFKHSQATRVHLTLTQEADTALLTIADNGIGFSPASFPPPAGPESWGLITMKERAEAIGGTLHIESEPGRGTKVIMEI